MSRNLISCIAWFALAAVGPSVIAQTRNRVIEERNRTVDELVAETNRLKQVVAAQEHRIVELEKTVKTLQAMVVPSGIPAATPAWHIPPNWNLIRKGMSRAEVVEILGDPASEDSVIDSITLHYRTDSKSKAPMSGTVKLTDDRVVAVTPPSF